MASTSSLKNWMMVLSDSFWGIIWFRVPFSQS